MQSNISASSVNLFRESDLKVYANIVWRWAWLIALCTLVAGGTAYVVSSLSTPIYQASATLLIDEASNPKSSNYQEMLAAERIARTYSGLMTRGSTLDQVEADLQLAAGVLGDDITDIRVTPQRDTQLVQVIVEGVNPSLVAHVANTLPVVFSKEIRTLQTERFSESKGTLSEQIDESTHQIELIQLEIDDIGKARTVEEEVRLDRLRNDLSLRSRTYESLLRSFEELRLAEIQSVDSIVIAEPASVPSIAIRPRVMINTVLAAIVGAMLVLGVIFLIEYLDDSIKSPQDLHSTFNTAFLGAIVQMPNKSNDGKSSRNNTLITVKEPRNPISEAYRGIRTNLQFSSVDRTIRSIVVTSANPGEGKSTTSANLAVVMAQSGLSVALIDADMRKPTQNKIFGASKSPGLTESLLVDRAMPLRFASERNITNLRLLPSGKTPPNPSELLGSNRMKELLQELHKEVDMIIIDAPPLLAVTDAQILSKLVDGVVLVVSSGTNRNAVLRAAEALQLVNARVLGTILNRLVRSSGGYSYYAYEGYYAEEEEAELPDLGMFAPNNVNGTVTSSQARTEEKVLN